MANFHYNTKIIMAAIVQKAYYHSHEGKPLKVLKLSLLVYRVYFTIFLGPLSLVNVIGKHLYGLASTFNVPCSHCHAVNPITTSKEHRSGVRGPLTYDVNTRAVLGCLHVGVSNTRLNNFQPSTFPQ